MNNITESLTAIDTLATEIPDEEVHRLIYLQRSLISFISTEKLVDKMKEIIDNSKCITFLSDRSRKFIDVYQPVFRLNLDQAKSEAIYGKSSNFSIDRHYTDDSLTNFRTDVIYFEIIHPFSTFMIETLIDLKKNDKVLEGFFKEIPTQEKLLSIIISNMFHIRTDLNKESSTCYLQYII